MERVAKVMHCDIISAEYQRESSSSARLIVCNQNSEQFSLWQYCSAEEFSLRYSEEVLLRGRGRRIRYHPGSREIVSIGNYTSVIRFNIVSI